MDAHVDGTAPRVGPLRLTGEHAVMLQTWFSPSFPVGAYSYSHGLEWLVESGEVDNPASLRCWVEGVLRHGSGRTDGIMLCAAWRAVHAGAWEQLRDVAELASALQPTAERRLENLGQGSAFCKAVAAAWPSSVLARFRKLWPGDVALAVAVGVAGAAQDVPLDALVLAHLQSFASNLVLAGVRLIPLGQSDGLRVTQALAPVVEAVARKAVAAELDEIGSAAILTDIASMRHEQQYSRLFRS